MKYIIRVGGRWVGVGWDGWLVGSSGWLAVHFGGFPPIGVESGQSWVVGQRV